MPHKRIAQYMLVGYRPGETMADVYHRFDRIRQAGCMPFPMVYERWRQPELRRFARWVIGRYYQIVEWEDYR